mmetsp:Transcript_53871/g.144216  ORF Transcript_53871/g.144216 Transcript_53871/m.144216 type:complete len:414 (-) Transcript_53871:125-1366(-)
MLSTRVQIWTLPSRAHLLCLLLFGQPGAGLQVNDDSSIAIGVEDRRRKPISVCTGEVLHEIVRLVTTRVIHVLTAIGHLGLQNRTSLGLGGHLDPLQTARLCLLKHDLHDALYPGTSQDVLRGGSASGAPTQHLGTQLTHEVRVGGRHGGRRPSADLLHQAGDVGRFERNAQRAALVENAAHGPDVGRPGVRFFLAHLGTQIVGCPNLCSRTGHGAGQDLGNAKITHLHIAALREEEVARLQVSVEHMPVVNVFYGQDGLRVPSQHLVLAERHASTLRRFYLLREVSSLAEIHNDAEPPTVNEALAITHNVRMLQRAQQLPLLDSVLGLSRGCLTHVHHLADELHPLRISHEQRLTERTFSNLPRLGVPMPLENPKDISMRTGHGSLRRKRKLGTYHCAQLPSRRHRTSFAPK